jgi:hypothetical protein
LAPSTFATGLVVISVLLDGVGGAAQCSS